VTEPEPSWWKYVAGRDADKRWSEFYASTSMKGGKFSERDQDFYLNAIKRLATDGYAKLAHRPPDAVNFWLVCHYLLGTAVATNNLPKAAAINTAELAKSVGLARGHSYKQIQRYARDLEKPASEFLAAFWQDLPIDWSAAGVGIKVCNALTLFVEGMVRKVA
jgi:hypothetical protein